MSLDVFDLMDHLKVKAAHTVGASMGGMIAQTMAILQPERVLSVCSWMSTTGQKGLPRADPEVAKIMWNKKRYLIDTHEGRCQEQRKVLIALMYPLSPPDDLDVYIDKVLKRKYDPRGNVRQIQAIIGQLDRRGEQFIEQADVRINEDDISSSSSVN